MTKGIRQPTHRYVPYEPGILCRKPGCTRLAEFEVYLYDWYPTLGNEAPKEFFEQDYTCPYLCRIHANENEWRAQGKRVPRGYVHYPFTNQNGAQGYTKYAPLSRVFPRLFTETGTGFSSELHGIYTAVNDDLIRHLAANPQLLRGIHPRRFEELIADLFARRGFTVSLTPATRDGGIDLYAVTRDDLGSHLYVVECKRYAANRKVGVEAVRGLYAMAEVKHATKGILVTTSYFSRDAIAFALPLEYRLSLHDFDALSSWLASLQKGSSGLTALTS